VLATLAEAWETKNHPIDAPDPITAIQFRMEQQGLTRKHLERMIGSRARVSEVLTGRRKLTIDMIRKVRSGLGISADLLIAPGSSPRRRKSPGRRTGPVSGVLDNHLSGKRSARSERRRG